MKKPKLSEIKFLGSMFGQNVWGNNDAEKAIQWYISCLEEEMDKNAKLEMENFALECKPKKGFNIFKLFN